MHLAILLERSTYYYSSTYLRTRTMVKYIAILQYCNSCGNCVACLATAWAAKRSERTGTAWRIRASPAAWRGVAATCIRCPAVVVVAAAAAAVAAAAAAAAAVLVVVLLLLLLLLLLRGLPLGRRRATRNGVGRAGAACAKGIGASRATRPQQFSKRGQLPAPSNLRMSKVAVCLNCKAACWVRTSVAVPAVVRVVGERTLDRGGADGGGETGGDDDDDDDEDDDAASDHTYASHEDASGESDEDDDDEDDDDEAL